MIEIQNIEKFRDFRDKVIKISGFSRQIFELIKVSLIGRQWALTAAHCCTGNILFKTVRFGSVSLSSGGVTRSVQNAFVHPDFHSETYAHDICILQLDDDIVYNENMNPICLETVNIPPS